MEEEKQEIVEFQKARQQLALLERQKNSLEGQSKALEIALKEIKNTKQKSVLKAIGNILIQKDKKDVIKELSNQKETIDLRISTMKKQEDLLINKMNKIRTKLEKKSKEKKDEK